MAKTQRKTVRAKKEKNPIQVIETLPSKPEKQKVKEMFDPNETPPLPFPEPAELVESPSKTNLPPVDSVVAKEAAELGLAIVDAVRDGSTLFITVQGSHPEDVTSSDSRKLAYDARHHYGFDNAGIEPHGGLQAVEGGFYNQAWRLTRGL